MHRDSGKGQCQRRTMTGMGSRVGQEPGDEVTHLWLQSVRASTGTFSKLIQLEKLREVTQRPDAWYYLSQCRVCGFRVLKP